MAKQLKRWQGWLLFFGVMVVVFVLGMTVSSLMERRAEVASIFNNRKVKMDSIEVDNQKFKEDFPLEYETWAQTSDTTFESEFNGSQKKDVLAQRPEMAILWAGYAFSWDYNSPRGHRHAVEDIREILRTGAPGVTPGKEPQPGTCWTCKGPDVPRLMAQMGPAAFYQAKWSDWGNQMMNTVGCADCHDPKTMDLRPARPALYEAWQRRGMDVKKASHQEMRSLVCAQCHTEYYFQKGTNYLTFPQDSGVTVEAMEKYYDKIGFYDYIHALSRTPILKAQHPGYELSQMGIHSQRGVSCADCHMPYITKGGIKYTDHHKTHDCHRNHRLWPLRIFRLYPFLMDQPPAAPSPNDGRDAAMVCLLPALGRRDGLHQVALSVDSIVQHPSGHRVYLYQHSQTRNPQQEPHACLAESLVCPTRHRLHVCLCPIRCRHHDGCVFIDFQEGKAEGIGNQYHR